MKTLGLILLVNLKPFQCFAPDSSHYRPWNRTPLRLYSSDHKSLVGPTVNIWSLGCSCISAVRIWRIKQLDQSYRLLLPFREQFPTVSSSAPERTNKMVRANSAPCPVAHQSHETANVWFWLMDLMMVSRGLKNKPLIWAEKWLVGAELPPADGWIHRGQSWSSRCANLLWVSLFWEMTKTLQELLGAWQPAPRTHQPIQQIQYEDQRPDINDRSEP